VLADRVTRSGQQAPRRCRSYDRPSASSSDPVFPGWTTTSRLSADARLPHRGGGPQIDGPRARCPVGRGVARRGEAAASREDGEMLAQTRLAGLEQASSPRGGSSKQQRPDGTAHSCSRPEGGARRAAAGRSLLDECDHRASDRGVIATDGRRARGAGATGCRASNKAVTRGGPRGCPARTAGRGHVGVVAGAPGYGVRRPALAEMTGAGR
jgi:hypothetical protein